MVDPRNGLTDGFDIVGNLTGCVGGFDAASSFAFFEEPGGLPRGRPVGDFGGVFGVVFTFGSSGSLFLFNDEGVEVDDDEEVVEEEKGEGLARRAFRLREEGMHSALSSNK